MSRSEPSVRGADGSELSPGASARRVRRRDEIGLARRAGGAGIVFGPALYLVGHTLLLPAEAFPPLAPLVYALAIPLPFLSIVLFYGIWDRGSLDSRGDWRSIQEVKAFMLVGAATIGVASTCWWVLRSVAGVGLADVNLITWTIFGAVLAYSLSGFVTGHLALSGTPMLLTGAGFAGLVALQVSFGFGLATIAQAEAVRSEVVGAVPIFALAMLDALGLGVVVLSLVVLNLLAAVGFVHRVRQ